MYIQKVTEQEVLDMAKTYVSDELCTIRKLSNIFPYCKSTIHRVFRKMLKELDPELYKEVCKKIEYNIIMGRHRGGQSFKLKRAALKANNK